MNIPGMGLIKGAEGALNRVHVPMTRGLGLAELLKKTFEQMQKEHLGAFAGSLAYRGLFAIFPFIAFLVSTLGFFGATDLVYKFIDRLKATLPAQAITLLRGQAEKLEAGDNAAFGFAALASIFVALYGVSGAFRAIMEAMNVMYSVEETRTFPKKYLISIGIALGVIALLLTALILIVAGPTIGGVVANAVGLGPIFRWTWNILQWPILILFVMLAFALVYYYAPDVEQRFKFITPGSLVAIVLWLLFSGLFSLYVNLSNLGATYGTIAGVVALMLYLYWSSFILLLGAEVNQIVEDASPEGKDTGERVPPTEKAMEGSTEHAGSPAGGSPSYTSVAVTTTGIVVTLAALALVRARRGAGGTGVTPPTKAVSVTSPQT